MVGGLSNFQLIRKFLKEFSQNLCYPKLLFSWNRLDKKSINFHSGGPYHKQTNPLVCLGTYVMKELNLAISSHRNQFIDWFLYNGNIGLNPLNVQRYPHIETTQLCKSIDWFLYEGNTGI